MVDITRIYNIANITNIKNNRGQFYIISAVIIGIAVILFFMLAYSYEGNVDNSYTLMFKMKNVKHNIEDCLRYSLYSNSNLINNLIYLKNYYKNNSVDISYNEIKFTNITYEAKNISYLFNQSYTINTTSNTTSACLYYNISNNGFAGCFNGTLNYTGYFLGYNLINISENNSISKVLLKNVSSQIVPNTSIVLYDNYNNSIINKSLEGDSVESGCFYYYVLNISKSDYSNSKPSNTYDIYNTSVSDVNLSNFNYSLVLLGYAPFSNYNNENLTVLHIKGYYNNSSVNNTIVDILINGSFEGNLTIKCSDNLTYSKYINKSENFTFNNTLPAIFVRLSNKYNDTISYNILNSTNNNFSEYRYLLTNESINNRYFNIIYGNTSKLYVSVHSGKYINNITIYSPQKGCCLSGKAIANIKIAEPNLYYESINNTYESIYRYIY